MIPQLDDGDPLERDASDRGSRHAATVQTLLPVRETGRLRPSFFLFFLFLFLVFSLFLFLVFSLPLLFALLFSFSVSFSSPFSVLSFSSASPLSPARPFESGFRVSDFAAPSIRSGRDSCAAQPRRRCLSCWRLCLTGLTFFLVAGWPATPAARGETSTEQYGRMYVRATRCDACTQPAAARFPPAARKYLTSMPPARRTISPLPPSFRDQALS